MGLAEGGLQPKTCCNTRNNDVWERNFWILSLKARKRTTFSNSWTQTENSTSEGNYRVLREGCNRSPGSYTRGQSLNLLKLSQNETWSSSPWHRAAYLRPLDIRRPTNAPCRRGIAQTCMCDLQQSARGMEWRQIGHKSHTDKCV